MDKLLKEMMDAFYLCSS